MTIGRTLRLASLTLFSLLVLAACSVADGPDPDPDPDPDAGATALSLDPPAVGFPGTSSATLEVEADGEWAARSTVPWLGLSRTRGDGNATITLTVDRSGLTPGAYVGLVRFSSAAMSSDVGVAIAMNFPRIRGAVTYPDVVTLDRRDAEAGRDGPSGDEIDGEWLVLLDRGLAAAVVRGPGLLDLDARPLAASEIRESATALADRHGLAEAEVLGGGTPVLHVRASDAAARALRADPRVRDVSPNRRLEMLQFTGDPNDPRYPDQWHYPLIDLPGAWEVTTGSDQVIVGVVDGGYGLSHEDLATKWVAGMDFASDDLENDNTPDATGTGCARHGTHVAGTIAARTDNATGVAGVAPESRLIPVQIGAPSGSGECGLDTKALAMSLKYLLGEEVTKNGTTAPALTADQLPRVVNLSIGGRNPLSGAIEDLLEQLHAAGVVVVAATGNDAGTTVMYPAAYGTTIAVGATDHEGNLASYSAYGSGLDVLAPGGSAEGAVTNNVLSTLPRPNESGADEYGYMAGTSMAAPHVAGVAALLLAQDATLGVEDVRGLLQRSADGFADGWTPERGYGLIDARAALDAMGDDRHANTLVELFPGGGGGSRIEATNADEGGTFLFETYLEAGDYSVVASNSDTGDVESVDVTLDYVSGDAYVEIVMNP